MKDGAEILAMVAVFEIIKWTLGTTVALAVAVTALIACVLFLWHAGKDAA